MHTLHMLFIVRSKYFITVGYIVIMTWAVSSRNRGVMPADSIELPLCSILKSRRMRWAGCLADWRTTQHKTHTMK